MSEMMKDLSSPVGGETETGEGDGREERGPADWITSDYLISTSTSVIPKSLRTSRHLKATALACSPPRVLGMTPIQSVMLEEAPTDDIEAGPLDLHLVQVSLDLGSDLGLPDVVQLMADDDAELLENLISLRPVGFFHKVPVGLVRVSKRGEEGSRA
jgi:hypothetical protein